MKAGVYVCSLSKDRPLISGPMPVEPADKVRGLHPDILILLECESKRVK